MITTIIAHLSVFVLVYLVLFEIYKVIGNIMLAIYSIHNSKNFKSNFLTLNTFMLPIMVVIVVYFWA